MTCQGTKAVVMMRQEVSNDTLRAFKKDSDDDARIYDTDGYWLRAACVCVKVICRHIPCIGSIRY